MLFILFSFFSFFFVYFTRNKQSTCSVSDKNETTKKNFIFVFYGKFKYFALISTFVYTNTILCNFMQLIFWLWLLFSVLSLNLWIFYGFRLNYVFFSRSFFSFGRANIDKIQWREHKKSVFDDSQLSVFVCWFVIVDCWYLKMRYLRRSCRN